jgi:hypothetical protein
VALGTGSIRVRFSVRSILNKAIISKYLLVLIGSFGKNCWKPVCTVHEGSVSISFLYPDLYHESTSNLAERNQQVEGNGAIILWGSW